MSLNTYLPTPKTSGPPNHFTINVYDILGYVIDRLHVEQSNGKKRGKTTSNND
jgi:hypothetical protein